MTDDQDHYEAYYADKLWGLLPAVYRAQDTDDFGSNGPLRELVDRVGAQAAVLRRGLDRMWDDQSIETCDDWIIPYLGDLLATNLVTNLDARGRRLDVAKTIYYRRRKGTPAILEEIGRDVTGWEVKVVESFRRLGRTRHGLDPAPGLPSAPGDAVDSLRLAEGLVGPLTGTRIGGTANIRDVYGASRAGSAFDEFFRTVDVRRGRGRTGLYNIPKLGVYLWRLRSFGVGPATPVPVLGCPGWFTFDPTGRDVPLFAADSRTAASFGEAWTAPIEAQMPGPIDQALFNAPDPGGRLYPGSLAVYTTAAPTAGAAPVPLVHLKVRPSTGRYHFDGPAGSATWGVYHEAFSSEIGAGPYDRRIGRAEPPQPAPVAAPRSGGGAMPGGNLAGTITLADSLTYVPSGNLNVVGALTIAAGPRQRPVVRSAPIAGGWPAWTFTGGPVAAGLDGPCLVLDGLLLTGGDLVLAGSFDCVTLTCCTVDPGNPGPTASGPAPSPPSSPFATAADGRELAPCRVWVDGVVGTLTVDRCLLGPIRARGLGRVDTLAVSDSILQAIPSVAGSAPIMAAEVMDPAGLERRLGGAEPVAAYLRSKSPGLALALGMAGSHPIANPAEPLAPILQALNLLLAGPSLYDPTAFATVTLSASTRALLASASGPKAPALNRRLIEDAFPFELADAALAFADGEVDLDRCTVLGRVAVHRLRASECILRELTVVDDTQHGCVRFSAWADGSVIPRPYESVRIPQGASLFSSTGFGRPGYGQLLETVDADVLPAAGAVAGVPAASSIASGAEDGSEMGAFARERDPIKERGLLAKFQEFMPAGLVPVLVHVT